MTERMVISSAALVVKSHLETHPNGSTPGVVSASALAICHRCANYDVLGYDRMPVTSRQAARINTGNLVGQSFRQALISEIREKSDVSIFDHSLELEITMSQGCVLKERIDYILVEEDGSLSPVILKPTLTHDWKPISERDVISPEDRTRLLIACRMLEKAGPLKGRQISAAEIVYVCLGGNQYTHGSVKGFPILWNDNVRQEIITYVYDWHQRLLAGEDQPVSTNPNCADTCPFGQVCTKINPETDARQLSLDSVKTQPHLKLPVVEREPIICFDCGAPSREDRRHIGRDIYQVDTICTSCGALIKTIECTILK